MLKKIFSLTAAALLLFACTDDEWPAQPDWSQIPNPDEEVDDGLLKPAACTNNIVAHRGGATECKAPDNSLASLRYAIGQGCYGSECDIYWTKDDNVVVAHADGKCQINGMHPWEHTLAELRAGGGLSNGEQLPSLEDFLGEVMKEGCPTRLWLDIKNITYPSTLTEYAINAARRSCEIATEMGAKHFVEFICTGNTTVMKSAFAYAKAAGIPIGWMSNRPAGEYVGLGYSWANLSAASYMSAEAGGKGTRTLEEFEKEGVALSVFNVDRQAGDGNAVYTTEAVDYYCSAAGRFKALCTNYPAWLIEKVEAATKVYDGIRSEADLRAFAAEVAVDPTAERFQNAAGEVVLHTDIAVSEAWTPIAGFAGVFDGNGKTLTVNYSGSDEQAGIFATLDGTVKNLRVAGSFTTTATAKVTLGAVAGKLGEKAQIVGCTNTAGIAMNVDASGTTVIGGIFGQGAAGNVIADNTNEGRITVRRKTPGDAAAVAGVGGWAYSDVTGCVNKGEIRYSDEVSAAKAVYVGGVLGRLDIGKGYVVEDCRNEAPRHAGDRAGGQQPAGRHRGLRQRREPRYAQHDPQLREPGRRSGRCPRVGQGEDRSGPHGRYLRRYGGLRGEYQLRQGRGPGRRQGRIGVLDRRYQRHDRARCDRLPQLRRRAQQHRQGESSRPYRRSVRMGDARLHDHRLRAGCRRGVDDALQLRRRQGYDCRSGAREQQLRGHSGRTHQVEDRGNGRIGEDLRQADADDKRRGADQDDRFHDDGAGRQLSLRCVAGCGFQAGRRAGSDHLRFDCEVIRKYANGGLRFPILF